MKDCKVTSGVVAQRDIRLKISTVYLVEDTWVNVKLDAELKGSGVHELYKSYRESNPTLYVFPVRWTDAPR